MGLTFCRESAYYFLLTTCYLLLATCYSLLSTCCLPSAARVRITSYLLLTTHYLLLAAYLLPREGVRREERLGLAPLQRAEVALVVEEVHVDLASG